MKKTIASVFLLIGVLVLCLLIWAVFFNNSLGTAWNAVQSQINTAWNAVVGGNQQIVSEWDDVNTGGAANVTAQASSAGQANIN